MLASEMLKQFDGQAYLPDFEAERKLQRNLLLVFLLMVKRTGGRLAVDVSEEQLMSMIDREVGDANGE